MKKRNHGQERRIKIVGPWDTGGAWDSGVLEKEMEMG
jgi:hypothetical protein